MIEEKKSSKQAGEETHTSLDDFILVNDVPQIEDGKYTGRSHALKEHYAGMMNLITLMCMFVLMAMLRRSKSVFPQSCLSVRRLENFSRKAIMI